MTNPTFKEKKIEEFKEWFIFNFHMVLNDVKNKQVKEFLSSTIDEAYEGGKKDLLEGMLNALPVYIESQYPKGKSKDRGAATVHITLYLTKVINSLDK